MEIPYSHSEALFNGLVEQYLPPLVVPPTSPGEARGFDWSAFNAASKERQVVRSTLVTMREIPGFGTVHHLGRLNGSGEVTFVEGRYGAHDRIGLQESLMDLVENVFFASDISSSVD